METQRFSKSSIVKWTVLLVLICIALALALEGPITRRNVERSFSILSSIVTKDARFQRIRFWWGTNNRIGLGGSVASREDLDHLRRAVEQAHPPIQPAIQVTVDSQSSNDVLNPAAATTPVKTTP
ncbi:MAG: hypothetical protein HZA91_06950 [Verrucomicrobia bacterium]|nr:hypothetical protein [Verrucomicrobiota bacterium]